jgi:hypothetical protein
MSDWVTLNYSIVMEGVSSAKISILNNPTAHRCLLHSPFVHLEDFLAVSWPVKATQLTWTHLTVNHIPKPASGEGGLRLPSNV